MALRFDAETVLELMAAGNFAAHLALDYGVTRQAVSKRLLRYSKERYRAAMEQGASARLLKLLRQSRDDGDVPEKAILREALYCERRAPRVLANHASLIQATLQSYSQPSRTIFPTQDAAEDLAVLERMGYLKPENKWAES